MRIAVAGAAGEVGRSLRAALEASGYEVVGVSARAGSPDAGDAVSYSEAAAAITRGGLDLVVHASGPGDRRGGGRTGLDASVALGPAVASAGVPAVLVSTTRVLEGYADGHAEDAVPRPLTPYAAANAASEERWKALAGPGASILRVANFFCTPTSGSSPQAGLLPWSLLAEGRASGSIRVRSAPSVSREFVDAADAAAAVLLLAGTAPGRTAATLPGVRLSLEDLVAAVGDAMEVAGLPRPVVEFGAEAAGSTPLTQATWLAGHGWHAGVSQASMTSAMAGWIGSASLP